MEKNRLLDRLINFVNLRPRSEFEIKRWLVRKKVDAEDGDSVFIQLKRLGLVDDLAFSRWWVEQRSTFRPKAKRALVMELRKKGVSKELAEEVVGKSEVDDEEIAFHLIEKKKKSWDKLDPEARKKKIINFLNARGFGWNVINKIIK